MFVWSNPTWMAVDLFTSTDIKVPQIKQYKPLEQQKIQRHIAAGF
jgi:hypothetical protein